MHLLRVRLRQLLICYREAGEKASVEDRREKMRKTARRGEIVEREAREWNQIEMERGRKRREREECSQTLLMPSPIETALFP